MPKKKHITFLNEHKRQEIKNIITADIECCVINITEQGETSTKSHTNKYVIGEHIQISVGYMLKGNSKHYFGPDCIKRFASDLLTIETE